MAEIITRLIFFVLEISFEYAGYYTARIPIPSVTCGLLKVQPIKSDLSLTPKEGGSRRHFSIRCVNGRYGVLGRRSDPGLQILRLTYIAAICAFAKAGGSLSHAQRQGRDIWEKIDEEVFFEEIFPALRSVNCRRRSQS